MRLTAPAPHVARGARDFDTTPAYLRVYLPGTPKNHRSPPRREA
jgi:hypothetical protein